VTSDDGIYHSIRQDKGTKTCGEILKNFEGVVVGDQAQTHYAAQRESEIDGAGFQFAGCCTRGHKGPCFRRFRDAAKDFPNQANPVLEMISNM